MGRTVTALLPAAAAGAAAALSGLRHQLAPIMAGGAAIAAWRPRSVLVCAALAPAVFVLVQAAGVLRGRVARRRLEASARADVVVLAELAALGISAGLTLPQAVRAALPLVAPPLAAEVSGTLRRAAVIGLADAFEEAGGRAGGLFRLAARAVGSGAPLGAALAGFADAARDGERATRLAAARRLPVLLLIPLTLLILPGFVVVTAGPALLGGLARLGL